VLTEVEVRDGRISRQGPELDGDLAGVVVRTSPAAFEVDRALPGGRPLFYRLGRGRLQVSDDLAAFDGDGTASAPDHSVLLALIHGLTEPPDSTPIRGVCRLTVGTRVRVDATGVSVEHRAPPLAPDDPRQRTLTAAVGEVLADGGGGGDADYGIAYSGGLASAFLAAAARATGHRPTLFHADLGLDAGHGPPLAAIPGLETEHVRCDVSDLLDHNRITGDEPQPLLPDVEMRRQMMARLRDASGARLASGVMLENLVSTTLPDADHGLRGRRLLSCEPFHLSGTLATLRDAREVLARKGTGMRGRRTKEQAEVQQLDGPPGPQPTDNPTDADGSGLPGLTEAGREALKSARLAAGAVWRTHLEALPPVLGRVEADRSEKGRFAEADGATIVPALDPRVLAAIAGIPDGALGRIRRGRFCNQVPLRDALARAGVGPVREASSGFRARLAAATHLHRERRKVAAELSGNCALADLGLLEPGPVIRLLGDGSATADRALLLLRLVWIDRWLRKR
jgi:hypothetical protein